jgi:hypothetical protein
MPDFVLPHLVVHATRHCNFHCLGCTTDSPYEKSYQQPVDEVVDGLAQLRDAGVGIGRLDIAGGEPFLRQDLVDLIAAVRGAIEIECVHLVTNASLLEKRMTALLALRGLVDSLRVTIHPELLLTHSLDAVRKLVSVSAAVLDVPHCEVSVDKEFYVVRRLGASRAEEAPTCMLRGANCVPLTKAGLTRCDVGVNPDTGQVSREFVDAMQRDTLPLEKCTPALLKRWLANPRPEPCLYCSGASPKLAVPHLPALGGACGAATVIPRAQLADVPELSVVIPYRGNIPEARRNLEAAITHWATFFRGFELIVVQYDDLLGVRLDVASAAKVIELPWDGVFSLTKTRNAGIRAARGKVVCVADRDVVIPPSSVLHAYTKLLEGTFDAITPYAGRMAHSYADTYIPDVLAAAQASANGDRECLFGGAVFFRNDVFERFGYYDESFDGYGHEDNEFRLRMRKLGAKLGEINAPMYHMQHSVVQSSDWLDVERHDERGELVKQMVDWTPEQFRERHGLPAPESDV